VSPSFRDAEGQGYELQAVLRDEAQQRTYVVIGKGSEFSTDSRLYHNFGKNPSTDEYLVYVSTYFRLPKRRKTNVRALQPFGFPGETFRFGRSEDTTAALLQYCKEGKSPVYFWRPYSGSWFKKRLYTLDEGRGEPHVWANACFVYHHNTGDLKVEPNASSTS
jgi:hypothetical protein